MSVLNAPTPYSLLKLGTDASMGLELSYGLLVNNSMGDMLGGSRSYVHLWPFHQGQKGDVVSRVA